MRFYWRFDWYFVVVFCGCDGGLVAVGLEVHHVGVVGVEYVVDFVCDCCEDLVW